MKICIITHYYPPEIGAPQARLSEMARAWVKAGDAVTVITCFPNHPSGIIPDAYRDAYKKTRFMEEQLDGVRVIRCWVFATPNKGVAKRTLGHLSFMLTAMFQGARFIKGSDAIVVSSPSFFSVIAAYCLSRRYSVPYVFEVRDLWPAIFVDLGILKNRLLIALLERIEVFLYRKAAAIVTVTKSFAKNIASRNVDNRKIFTITNGADTFFLRPRAKDFALATKLGLGSKCVVLYMGAHGISHALGKIIEVAARLRQRTELHFLFVGEGAEKETIVKMARELQLTNVTFLPGQPKEKVAPIYSVADICLVPLRDIPLFETFIPSKMFEIMAMERPIIASVRGEAHDILKESCAAILCPPENVEAISSAVLELAGDQERRMKLAAAGRAFVERNYDRNRLAQDYRAILAKVVEGQVDRIGPGPS